MVENDGAKILWDFQTLMDKLVMVNLQYSGGGQTVNNGHSDRCWYIRKKEHENLKKYQRLREAQEDVEGEGQTSFKYAKLWGIWSIREAKF